MATGKQSGGAAPKKTAAAPKKPAAPAARRQPAGRGGDPRGATVKTVAEVKKVRARVARRKPASPKPRAVKPKDRRLSLFEQYEYGKILAVERALDPPKSWAQLVKELGIPKTTLESLHAKWQRSSRPQLDVSGQAVLEQNLAIQQMTIEHMSDLAVNADSASAQIAASRVMLEAVKQQIRLMAAVNRMPRSFRAQQELTALATAIQKIMAIIERRDLGEEILQEFAEVLSEVRPVASEQAQLTAGELVAA